MNVPSSSESKSRALFSVTVLLGVGLVLVGGVALAWPAFDNGFPLVFQDTSWYLAPLFDVGQHPLRTIGYSILASIALTVPSFWSIVLAQSLTTSALLTRVAWVAADRPEDRPRLAVLGLLSVLVFSGAAKYASWLMADITASWLFLAGALWLMAPGRWDRIVAFGVGVVAVLAHNSHLPLALATSGTIVLVSLFRRSGVDRRATLGLLAATSMFVPCVWLTNAITTERAEVLRGTEAFLLYSLSDSGVLLDTLDAWCDEREWQMCSFRAEIADHVGENDGWLLFDPSSPFYRIGGHASREPRDVVLHAFRCCASRILWTTVLEAWAQFWEIDSRDGLLARDTEPALALLQSMARPSASRLLERMNAGWGRFETATAQRELAQLRGSRQHTSGDVRVLLHPFPEPVLQAVLLLSGAFMSAIAHRWGERRPAYLLGSLGVFLIANAVICAFGSSVFGRYQGRVAWLLTFAVAMAAWWTCRAWLVRRPIAGSSGEGRSSVPASDAAHRLRPVSRLPLGSASRRRPSAACPVG